MPDYHIVKKRVEVPRSAGVEGFLLVVRKVLTLPKVQSLAVTATGQVTYEQAVRSDEDLLDWEADFSSVLPWTVISNGQVDELVLPPDSLASYSLCRLFERAHLEQLFPVALVSGTPTTFWEWHASEGLLTTSPRDAAYGLPFLTDERCPPDTLLLCAAYTRSNAMIDVRRSFKLQLPMRKNAGPLNFTPTYGEGTP